MDYLTSTYSYVKSMPITGKLSIVLLLLLCYYLLTRFYRFYFDNILSYIFELIFAFLCLVCTIAITVICFVRSDIALKIWCIPLGVYLIYSIILDIIYFLYYLYDFFELYDDDEYDNHDW
jgi:hypothetical protein